MPTRSGLELSGLSPGRSPANSQSGSTTPIVRFAGVQKTYDGIHSAVADLDLTVERGEFVTLLGPSGSGKTSTLMMLAGFEIPTAGEIYLAGKSVTSIPPHRRDIGVVFQNYALFPHMSVAENIAFPLTVRNVPRTEVADRVARSLALVRLDGFGERKPSQLSGGQQQRVALARALVFDPLLVLMDEPLGALDRQLREHMQLEIKRLHQDLAITIVYVTHDQAEALTMSDRVAIFKDGRVQQVATPVDIYERPENGFVAQFIGENNRLRGTIQARRGDACIVAVANGVVEAAAIHVADIGDATTLSIRPERVLLGVRCEGCANRFDAVVREIIYLGDHVRMRLSLLGSDEFTVKVPNVPGATLPVMGATTSVGWHTADCRALNPE